MAQLADEIRKSLEMPGGISEETMRPLAAQFDEAVRVVNDRLDEAVSLLRKNLRSEAIQAANRRPNAIDAAANLDFPELPEWLEILQFLGVPVPQVVERQKVQQLNEAIVEEQPIEDLLRQHRRLAIAKAPLSWRLKVLRRIAKIDEMNPVWAEDIENYEAVRRKILADEVRQAIRDKDHAAIERLHTEITDAVWSVPPPAELAESLKQEITTHQQQSQIEILRKTAEQLHEAFSEFNESAARNIATQWHSHANSLGAAMPADLLEEVEPALTWLSELDLLAEETTQRDAAIRILEESLDSRRDLPSLEKAYLSVSRFEEPVPAALEQRFRTVAEEIRLAGKRKTQIVVVAVMAVAVLVASAVAFWQYRAIQQQRVADAVSQFGELVGSNKSSEALAFWNRLETQGSDLTSKPELMSLYSQLESQIQKEENRKEEFEHYLAEASNDDPAQIDRAALNEAEKLAVTENEKSRVFAVQQAMDKYARSLVEEQTVAALESVDAIRKELTDLEGTSLASVDLGRVGTLKATLDNISKLYPRSTRNVEGQVEIAKSRADVLVKAAQDYRRKMATIEAAKKPLLNASALSLYGRALESYSKAVQSSETGSEYALSVKESTSWQKGMQANEIPTKLKRLLGSGLAMPEIREMRDLRDKIESQVGLNPLLVEFNSVVAGTLSETGNPLAEIGKLRNDLSRLPLGQLVTMEASVDGEMARYFVYRADYERVRQQIQQQARIGVKVLSAADGAITNRTIDGPAGRVVFEPSGSVTWLLEELKARENSLLDDWGAEILKLCGEIRQRKDLDGLIKEDLIYRLLKSCSDGSSLMQQRLAGPLAVMRGRNSARERWPLPIAPSDSLAPEVETQVIANLSTIFSQIKDLPKQLLPATKLAYVWIGFLMRDDSGTIIGRLNQDPGETGTVYTMRPSPQNPAKVDFVSVGELKPDGIILEDNSSALNAGRPLFILSRNN